MRRDIGEQHWRFTAEKPNYRHCQLLRSRRERSSPAPPSSVMNSRRFISITSSARASSDGGTSRPSALAALRLIKLQLRWLLDRQVGQQLP